MSRLDAQYNTLTHLFAAMAKWNFWGMYVATWADLW